MASIEKPPYSVPSMSSVRALQPNGYTVASTFSGCGGSSLGYRMAGYDVRWANEFIPAAQETYRMNHTARLNTADIRTVSAEQLMEEAAVAKGELDILDGSPPCSAFSTAGRREEGWGRVKTYSATSQRVDDLFFEYTRLVKGVQPKVFVAENVKGLIIGTARGYFRQILREFRNCGYEVSARLLDASRLGVPQRRERLIFVGLRRDLAGDLGLVPVHPDPLPYVYTLSDALAGLTPDPETAYPLPTGKMRVLYNLSAKYRGDFEAAHLNAYGKGGFYTHIRLSWDRPSNTICQGARSLYHPDEPRSLSIAEEKRVCSFPDDFALTGSPKQQHERLGRSVPPVMMMHVARAIQERILDPLRRNTSPPETPPAA